MKKTLLIALFLTQLCFVINAQTFTTYKQSTGNSSDDDWEHVQFDKSTNLIWGGSRSYHAPLKKFDGVNWTNYSDSVFNCVSGETSSLIIDNAHNIWYSTLGYGISKYNGTSFTNYTASNSGLANNFVACMAMDNSSNLFLYADNFHQTQKFTGTTWTNLEMFSYGVAMSFDSTTNTVWMATQGEGLKKIQNSVITTFNTGNSGIPNDYVSSLTVDNNGSVWLVFDDSISGLVKFDGTTWTHYTSSNSGLLNNYIGLSGAGAIKSDKNGTIWIGGYYYQGLTKFNGVTWTSYNINYPNFPSMNIRDFAFGNNGVVWIGTDDGLVKMQLPLGILEASDNNSAKLYPNPITSQATISFTKELKNATIKITDVLGKEIRNVNFSGTQITFERENLKSGMYFYDVISENKKIATGKLIIQ
jgi:ligand-binding sensor domain-containing protein